MTLLQERRNVTRVGLGLDGFKELSTSQVFRVLEISAGGFSIEILDTPARPFQVGTPVQGEMKLFDRRIAVLAECRYLLANRAGFQILPGNTLFEEAFSRLLDPVTIGQSLRPVPAEKLEIAFDGISGGFAFFDREQDGSISSFECGALEHAVAWKSGDYLRTFHLEAQGLHSTQGTWISRRLDSRHHWVEDSELNAVTLEFIKKLLSQAKIEGRLKALVLRHFESPDEGIEQK